MNYDRDDSRNGIERIEDKHRIEKERRERGKGEGGGGG